MGNNQKKVSDILKFILATNYYISIIDEIQDTDLFSGKLKVSLKNTLVQLNVIQKKKVISEFFNNADRDLVQNNFDLHCEFFEFISEMKCLDLENFMIDFLKENKYSKLENNDN